MFVGGISDSFFDIFRTRLGASLGFQRKIQRSSLLYNPSLMLVGGSDGSVWLRRSSCTLMGCRGMDKDV